MLINLVSIIFLWFLSGATALASVTAVCSIDDENIEFTLTSTVAYYSDAIMPHEIKLRIKPQKDIREKAFEYNSEIVDENLQLNQQWLREPELRLRLTSLDAVDLILLLNHPAPEEDIDYVGSYEITIEQNGAHHKKTGKVSCSIGH